MYLLTFIDQI